MIEFKNVNKVYDGTCTALEDLNLQINDGEFVFVVGPSESGKSTIFRLLTQIDKPTSGSITVGEWDLSKMKRQKVPYYRRKLGIIFQDSRLFPKQTVFDNIALALRIVGEHSADVRMKSLTALKMVELGDVAKKTPDQLSVFDQQRVALARALAGGPGIIIADEPTGNMDAIHAKEFIELLIRIHSRFQKTVLVFTNGTDFVEEFGQRTIYLSRGVMEEDRAAVQPVLEELEEEAVTEYANSKDDLAELPHLSDSDANTQVFTAVAPIEADAVSCDTVQFDAVALANQDTMQFDAVGATVSQDTQQFDKVDTSVSQDTLQFDKVDESACQDTVQFDAITAPQEPAPIEDTVVDLPILPVPDDETAQPADAAEEETESLQDTVTFDAIGIAGDNLRDAIMKVMNDINQESVEQVEAPVRRRVFEDLTISDDWNHNEQQPETDSSSASTTGEGVQ